MITASQDVDFAALLLDDRIRSVPANVVESVDIALTISDDDDVKPCNGVSEVLARLVQSRSMCKEQPSS